MTGTRWAQEVAEHSNALDLEDGVFTWPDPERIARSLLRSAQASTRRKAKTPYRSAMSMLTFYMNRAGRSLPAERRDILNQAKVELRRLATVSPGGTSDSNAHRTSEGASSRA